jgi:hypothetical protein
MNLSYFVLQSMGLVATIAVLGKLYTWVDDPKTMRRKDDDSIHWLHNITEIAILAAVGSALGYFVYISAVAYAGDPSKVDQAMLSVISAGIGMIAGKAWKLTTETVEVVFEYGMQKVREMFKKKVDRYADDD